MTMWSNEPGRPINFFAVTQAFLFLLIFFFFHNVLRSRDTFCLLAYFSKYLGAGVQIHVSHMGGRSPSICAIICCLPEWTFQGGEFWIGSRAELGLMSRCSDRGCRYLKSQRHLFCFLNIYLFERQRERHTHTPFHLDASSLNIYLKGKGRDTRTHPSFHLAWAKMGWHSVYVSVLWASLSCSPGALADI